MENVKYLAAIKIAHASRKYVIWPTVNVLRVLKEASVQTYPTIVPNMELVFKVNVKFTLHAGLNSVQAWHLMTHPQQSTAKNVQLQMMQKNTRSVNFLKIWSAIMMKTWLHAKRVDATSF
jgi:hypothetical protein